MQITSLENNSIMDPWVKKWLLARYRRCLDRAIKKQGLLLLDEEGKEAAIQSLKNQPEFRYKAAAYGIMVDSLETIRARVFLDSLNATTSAELDFVAAQNIWLDYLEDRENYTLSYVDSVRLRTISTAQNPLAGFARSIYRVLTGLKIEVYLAHLNNQGELRSQKTNENKKVQIFPNPINEEGFTIFIPEFNVAQNYVLRIVDQLGVSVYNSSLDGQLNNIPAEWRSGLYYVEISSNGLSLLKQKIVKL